MMDKNQEIQNMIADMATNTPGITDEQVDALVEQLTNDSRNVDEIKDILDNLSKNIAKVAAGEEITKVDDYTKNAMNDNSSASQLDGMFDESYSIDNKNQALENKKQITLGTHPSIKNNKEKGYTSRRNDKSSDNFGFIDIANIIMILAFSTGLIKILFFLK